MSASSVTVRAELCEALRLDLVGPDNDHAFARELLPEAPSRWYLENPHAVEIDPVELKLSARTYETVKLNGVFGALRDAGPDTWGRRVIEKHTGKARLGELDTFSRRPMTGPARSALA